MRAILSLVAAAAIALFAVTTTVDAKDNPIFGGAKLTKLDDGAMKKVVGTNTTSAYYAYLGNYYGAVANQYGSYGAYLEAFGSGQQSARYTYYYYAYYFAYYSSLYYYYAYVTN